MRILMIGGGGREHALIKAIKKNPEVAEIFCLPGNGSIARDAKCLPGKATDISAIVRAAIENKIDYCVVAPDDPLALGAVDALERAGIPAFGPHKNAAEIEGSKAFAKGFMKRHGIPTAAFEVFDDAQKALDYVSRAPVPLVIKADGLALGKGVLIADTREAAAAAVKSMMQEKRFGKSGETIVVEEFLRGPEVSVLSLTDGRTIVPLLSSMDHKRALDGDLGPNTGGMGAVAPNPFYTEEIAERCMREIFLPTVEGLAREGRPFKGCLYFGLMLTDNGPKVIEYNCRFGDPETQAVLPLMQSDLLTAMRAVTAGRLGEVPVRFSPGACCCVVLASGGYPGGYEKGFPIDLNGAQNDKDVTVYGAGTALDQAGALVTAGGRVLGVSATAEALPGAVEKAYAAAKKIRFAEARMRGDIGARALNQLNGK